MEEQNAKAIEVKSHKREVRKPVMRKDLPVEETHIYPAGINLDEYTESGVETTDRIAIRPAVMYIDRTVRNKVVLKSSLQIEEPEKHTFVIATLPEMIIPREWPQRVFWPISSLTNMSIISHSTGGYRNTRSG